MSAVAAATRPAADALEHPEAVGPLGRLGGWTAQHVQLVAIAWMLVAVALGVFAPKVETALSGAGWQANVSQSVQARKLIQANFAGLSSSSLMVVLHSRQTTVAGGDFQRTLARVERLLRADRHVASVLPPRVSSSISSDGHTAIVTAGAKGDPT